MEFLRDYVGVFPAILAVVNGALAVFSTHYPFKKPSAKLRFIIAIVALLSFTAIGATFYSQHLVIAQRGEERAQRNMIRDQLGRFISEGTDLLYLAGTASASVPTEAANEWAKNAEDFLALNMGGSYVVRFRDRAGMPPINAIGVDEEHQKLWQGIYSRMLKLERFSEEVPQ
jgi:hypothetical protein